MKDNGIIGMLRFFATSAKWQKGNGVNVRAWGMDFFNEGLNCTGDYRGVVNDFITSYEYRNIRFPIN